MRQKVLVLAVVTALVFLSSCSSTLEKAKEGIEGIGGNERTGDYPTVSNTVKQGCLGGFAVGVTTNLVRRNLLDDKDVNLGKALRDGVIGAIVGCSVAEGLDRRRSKFSSDADHFDAEIIDARHQNDETRKLVAHTKTLTSESQSALAKLEADKASKKLEQEAVSKARSNAAADLRWAKNELKVIEGNLEQRQGASELMESKGEASRATQMDGEIEELQSYVDTLEREIASLASINDAIGELGA